MDDNRELSLRTAIITALKTDAAVAAIVADRVYDEPKPNQTWPFIRYGFPISTPWRADGWEGEALALTIHGFSKGAGRDEITALKTAIRNALDEVDLDIDGAGGVVLLQFAGAQIIHDTEEKSAHHAIIDFEAATATVA